VAIHRGRAVVSPLLTGTIRIPAPRTPSGTPLRQVVPQLDPPDTRETRQRGRRRLLVLPRSGHLESALVLTADLVLLAGLCAFATSLTLTVVTAAGAVLTWRARGLYSHRIALSVLDDLPELAIGVLVGLAPGAAAALVVPTGMVGATGTLKVAGSVLGVVVLARTLSYGVILRLRRQGRVSYRTLLIGAGRATRSIVQRIADHPESGLCVVGTIGNQQARSAALPVLGGSADLSTIVRTRHISNVVVGYGGISAADLVDVLRTADRADLEIHVVPRLFELASRRGSDDHIWGLPLVRLRAPANRKLTWRAKRGFDVLGASLALVLLSPLMVVLAASVRISLGPGVIFTQTRIGLHGRPFEMMKFRSMRPSVTGRQGVWTVPEDELGRVGRFIRRYSFDELPQLINVLRGDMSLVGPRPERPEYVDKFAALFPWYAHRHRVTVGMTGLAAVNGLRGDTSIEERCKFDNWYIDNWSLWLDTKIIVRTLNAVVRGTGG
jgi:exopolysaccharide biosynthesis polyprenyl glycosylphosphotransferase